MAIDALPTPPSSSDPLNFNTRADAYLLALNTFTSQVNAALALMNSPSNVRIVDVVDGTGLAIATAYAAGQVIDGITLTAGMRILRATPTQHLSDGIYDAPASGAASRSTDSNSSGLLASGLSIQATRGTAYGGSNWVHKTAPGFTLNTTALYFTRRNEIKETGNTGAGVLASPSASNICSITLQPGRWRLSCNVQENGSGAPSNNYFTFGISTNSASFTGATQGKSRGYVSPGYDISGGAPLGMGTISGYEVQITSATTYYLVGATRSNSDSMDGWISALRLD